MSLKQLGFSVIELMVAMLLGLLIIAGLINVFISSSTTYRVQQAKVEVQEKGRYILRRLRIDIQKAGYSIDSTFGQLAINFSPTGSVADYGAEINGVDPIEGVLEIFSLKGGDIKRVAYFRSGDSFFRNEVKDVKKPDPTGSVRLVNGLVWFQLRFAINDGSDESNSIEQLQVGNGGVNLRSYFLHDELIKIPNLTDPYLKARAVEVEIIVRSDTGNILEDSGQSITLPSGDYQFPDKLVVLGVNGPNSGRIFQGYSTTYAMRNKVQ